MYLTQTQYAKHRTERGTPCTQQAVSKAVRAGKIPVTEDGRIDPDVADALWPVARGPVAVDRPQVNPASVSAAASVAPPAVSVASPVAAVPQSAPASSAEPQQPALSFVAPPAAGTAASEQAALARARREKIELDMAAKRAELQPLADFDEAWSAATIAVRNKFLMIPRQIADPGTRALVDRLIREALADLSHAQLTDLRLQVRDEVTAA